MMDLPELFFDVRICSSLIGILFLLYLYCHSRIKQNYWKRKGIPSARTYPFLGSAEFKKCLSDVEEERYSTLGRIYGYYEGTNPVISIAEPELLKRILVKDFHFFSSRRIFDMLDHLLNKGMMFLRGEDWKRIRTIITPTFTTGKIKRVLRIFEDCSKVLIKNLKSSSTENGSTDVLKFYGAFTMDVIASSAFSTKLDSHNDPENEFVMRAKDFFSFKLGFKIILFMTLPRLAALLGFSPFDMKTIGFFERATLEIIEERKKTGQTRNDFLQLLLDTAKEVSEEEKQEEKLEDIISNYGDDSINHPVFKNVINKQMSMDELIAQCIFFFLAGYHTTATSLGLTTYYLALHQDIQDKLFQEMKDVLSETDGELTYEAVQKMKYLDNVISETLRINSPVLWLERTAEADYKLGDTGITIPKGMVVHIPVYAMQRDPEFFPDPEKFNPDRFNQEEREVQLPYSYTPFGAGPRNCVAMRFALMELKVCLVYVLSTFKAKTCPQTKIPIEFAKGSGLLRPLSIDLLMEPRTENLLKS